MTWITEAYANGDLPVHPNKVVLTTKMPKFESLDDEKTARADKLDVVSTKLKSKRTAIEDRNMDYDEEMREIQEEALREIDWTVEQLVKIKEAEEKYDIKFAENSQTEDEESTGKPGNRDTSKSRRAGEKKTGDLDEEDARDRRKEDGNYELHEPSEQG